MKLGINLRQHPSRFPTTTAHFQDRRAFQKWPYRMEIIFLQRNIEVSRRFVDRGVSSFHTLRGLKCERRLEDSLYARDASLYSTFFATSQIVFIFSASSGSS